MGVLLLRRIRLKRQWKRQGMMKVIPLPDENDYVDGSWRVTEEDVEIVRTLYNNNQKDD